MQSFSVNFILVKQNMYHMIVTSKDSCQAVCIEGEGRFVAVFRCKGLRVLSESRVISES